MSNQIDQPITVTELLRSCDFSFSVAGNTEVTLTGITQDSREVRPGDLYCCVRGAFFDGHDFIEDAIRAGAVAILLDDEVPNEHEDICFIRVENVRQVLGLVASALFAHPSRSLKMVGITGTNGKTSTVAIVASIMQAHGSRVEVLGTLSGARTTPEAIELQAILRSWVNEGIDTVVMEVSSHGLDQGRVTGIMFDVVVLTNITRDHLDYHGTEENYFAAKAKLFAPEQSLVGVVNTDDTRGRLLFDVGAIPMVPYAVADAENIDLAIDHVSFTWSGTFITVPMGGRSTLFNALAALTATSQLGVSAQDMQSGCAALSPVPGRYQTLTSEDGVHVVVDYAHTPDGLREVLDSVRPLTSGQVIVVFGCGGERDAGKRPLMGKIASELADVVYVTSDNPRAESPDEIISQIMSGIQLSSAEVKTQVQREIAIASAISVAQRGDIVVIAGKGHESTQEVAGVHFPFSDVEIATAACEQRKGGAR
jgi:UDP-N-acetylmuramoyl-L-alanyl-D-glutamate--2,6-diaminopimelate ligase